MAPARPSTGPLCRPAAARASAMFCHDSTPAKCLAALPAAGPQSRRRPKTLRRRCLRDSDRFVVDGPARRRLHALEIDESRWRRGARWPGLALGNRLRELWGGWHMAPKPWDAFDGGSLDEGAEAVGNAARDFPSATGCFRAAPRMTGRSSPLIDAGTSDRSPAYRPRARTSEGCHDLAQWAKSTKQVESAKPSKPSKPSKLPKRSQCSATCSCRAAPGSCGCAVSTCPLPGTLVHHVPESVACAAQERGTAAMAAFSEPESSIGAAAREHGSCAHHM